MRSQPHGIPERGVEEGELVVLVDEAGRAVGTSAKADVHHADTPLHLAFSCYVFDGSGRLLVTRRALAKATFPGVWTNTLCGHPAPGEALTGAVARRAAHELGLAVGGLRLVLPRFRYRAEQDGVVERELCPVLVAVVPAGVGLHPDPTEVEEARWLPWQEFLTATLGGEPGWSQWCREQAGDLSALGPDPAAWPTAEASLLPAAARLA